MTCSLRTDLVRDGLDLVDDGKALSKMPSVTQTTRTMPPPERLASAGTVQRGTDRGDDLVHPRAGGLPRLPEAARAVGVPEEAVKRRRHPCLLEPPRVRLAAVAEDVELGGQDMCRRAGRASSAASSGEAYGCAPSSSTAR